MYVGKRMTCHVITAKKEDRVRAAVEKLKEHRIRQLPVVEGNKVVGIVTDRDLRQASSLERLLADQHTKKAELESFLDRIRVEEIMIRRVITVTPEDTVEDAAKILHDYKIGGLPVVKEGKLVGIITSSDILKAFLEVMGIGVPSSRLEVTAEDRPGQLAEIAQVIRRFQVNIVSLVTAHHPEEVGKRIIILRINSIYPNPIAKALEEAGFRVQTP